MLYAHECDYTDFEVAQYAPGLDEDTRAFVEFESQDAAQAYCDLLTENQDSDFPIDIAAELRAFWDEAFREYKARMIQRYVAEPWREDWELESRRREARTYTDWENSERETSLSD
jgi:hypothetical protein